MAEPRGFDILIRGGAVICGSGAPRFEADVGVGGDLIVAIGPLPASAKRVVRAAGKVAAPGFIDAPTHDDRASLSHPAMPFLPPSAALGHVPAGAGSVGGAA